MNKEPIIYHNDSRYYLVGDKYVPSVTSILSWYKKDIIAEWTERVGEKEANKIKNLAANSGTRMHDSLEDYVKTKWIDKVNTDECLKRIKKNPITYDSFSKIKKHLDKNLGSVLELETQLSSPRLKTAGRCDLIGDWNDIPSIIDFKSSKWMKNKDYIETYFLQTTAYSLMYQEMFGTKIEQLVILFSTTTENYCYDYVEHRSNYIEKLVKVINSYYRENKDLLHEVNLER